MAIKASNQITFTEQKKILEIKEWYLATYKDSGVTIDPVEGWTKEVQTMSETNKYLWNYEEVIYSIGSSEKSEPIIIGFYGKGTDGKGITDIKNYYFITQNPELPANPEWSDTVLMLTPTDKYLWNYEEFIYTDGQSRQTDPAIIGVYGDSGADTLDFQIYSVDGFEFSASITSINLQTAAFQNGQKIDGDITYQWKWWNEDEYEAISEATSPTIVVNSTDPYATSSLKCEATYNGVTYEDYVSLTRKTDVYTASVKFWNGNNSISNGNGYIIAYVELYKNNMPENKLYSTDVYVSNANAIQDTTITTDKSGTFSDGDYMYFVCKKTYSGIEEYDVVLGEYGSGKWRLIPDEYSYKNDLFTNSTSSIVFIPKEKISGSLNVNFTIYNNDAVVARTNTVVLDLNDPIVGEEPSEKDRKTGMLWLDSKSGVLKIWNGTEWANSGYQNGNAVYTSRPTNGYSAGDLWILAEGEVLGSFKSGSMLKASRSSSVFNAEDWNDANDVVTNVKESFTWDNEGVQIAKKVVHSSGNTTKPFYVHIDSEKMGFHSVSYNSDGSQEKDVEVVHIGNNSAVIQNATLAGDGGTTFNNNATFNQQVQFWNFIFTKETNGSLSLSVN